MSHDAPPPHAISGAGAIDSPAEAVSEGAAVGRGVPGEYLIEGFRRARQRFLEASSRGRLDGVETFIPLFEALNWAAAIEVKVREDAEEQGRQAYDEESADGRLLAAIRFIRGRMHHRWALAHDPRDIPVATVRVALGSGVGRSGVLPPAVVLEWYWLPPEHLARPHKRHKHKKEEAAYRELLAGHPVRLTLDEVAPVLERLCKPDE